jgi:O-antigen ligase/tetratricopeptide (TPR) repeat protein
MLVLRVGKDLALWTTVLSVGVHGYFRTATTASLDTRVPWAVPILGSALLAGYLLAALVSRLRKLPLPSLGPDRHAICLLVAGLCLNALSHVEPHTSIRVLREEIPREIAWIYPALCFLLPGLLRATARRVDAADHFLITALCLTCLSGAVMLMSGAAALSVSLVAVLAQLHAGGHRSWREPVLWFATCVIGLLVVASWNSMNSLTASTSRAWILAAAGTGLAVALRPRGAADWRRLLGAPVATALVIAIAGLAVTNLLADQVGWEPAIHTRLRLFRQHPNFLAPFFAMNAVVAFGLAVSGRRLRLVWFLGAALLAGSTWMTDSRAGLGLLALGAAGIPMLYGLSFIARRFSLRVLLLVSLLGGVGLMAVGSSSLSDGVYETLSTRIDRFEKSLDYRVDAWRNSLEIIGEYPLLGVGPGTFLSLRRFQPGSLFFNEPSPPHPHNVLLYVAQAAGVAAAVLFVLWVLALVHKLWHAFQWGSGPAPRFLIAATLSATLALLAANVLDVGLSRDSVVPTPIFLLTGLAVASRTAAPRPSRPGPALIWLAVVGPLFLFDGLNGVRAQIALEQGKLHHYMAGQGAGDPELMRAEAREHMARAIRLAPDREFAYELLARWLESTPDGFAPAIEVLDQLVSRAESYGRGHSLIAQMCERHGRFEQAAAEYRRALDGVHGSASLKRDRVALIRCLAWLGRRQEALDELVRSLRLDVTVVDELPFRVDPGSQLKYLVVGESFDQEPIRLTEAVEVLWSRNRDDQENGRGVGRKIWMDTYTAFRKANRDDRALEVLAYLETNKIFDEPYTFEGERGHIARTAERYEDALRHFERAATLAADASRPFYRSHANNVRALLGESVSAEPASLEALVATGEILDQPNTFADILRMRADAKRNGGDPAAAGRILIKTLLYEDGIVRRALLLEQIGNLFIAGEAYAEAEAALLEAMHHLDAKPFGMRSLAVGYTRSMPGRIALAMCRSWAGRGLTGSGMRNAAWRLDDFFSARLAWSLFRLKVYSEVGQPDALLREAELILMRDEQNLVAQWATLEAKEALGHWSEAAGVMRGIAESFALRFDVRSLHEQAVAKSRGRTKDPQACFDLAILNLIRGRCQEAANWFGRSIGQLRSSSHDRAHIVGWQARATFLAAGPGAQGRAVELLEKTATTAPACGSLRLRRITLQP